MISGEHVVLAWQIDMPDLSSQRRRSRKREGLRSTDDYEMLTDMVTVENLMQRKVFDQRRW